jgi:ATP adenylyltransferase
METLWTPWRMGYVGGERATGCIFCDKPAGGDDRANLILHRGANAFVIMNLYPYNTGHVMIVPYTHAATLPALPPAALGEMAALLPWVTGLLERTLRPHGFNVGLNIGEVAGAGVADHLHMHVVPRWGGDANFMPILANTMVLPELIPVTQARLLGEIARTPYPALADDPGVAEQAGGVVFDVAGRIALRRAKKGDWVLPKGHIEAGESAAAAAVREVAEEMGLATRIVDWLGDYRFTYKKARHVGYFLLHVEAHLPDFAAHDNADTFLLPPDDALARLTFDNDRAIVQRAIERNAAIVGQGGRDG